MATIRRAGEKRTCARAAANRRYLGQRESNGYCYSLFRNNPKLVRELTSRVATLESHGGPKISRSSRLVAVEPRASCAPNSNASEVELTEYKTAFVSRYRLFAYTGSEN